MFQQCLLFISRFVLLAHILFVDLSRGSDGSTTSNSDVDTLSKWKCACGYTKNDYSYPDCFYCKRLRRIRGVENLWVCKSCGYKKNIIGGTNKCSGCTKERDWTPSAQLVQAPTIKPIKDILNPESGAEVMIASPDTLNPESGAEVMIDSPASLWVRNLEWFALICIILIVFSISDTCRQNNVEPRRVYYNDIRLSGDVVNTNAKTTCCDTGVLWGILGTAMTFLIGIGVYFINRYSWWFKDLQLPKRNRREEDEGPEPSWAKRLKLMKVKCDYKNDQSLSERCMFAGELDDISSAKLSDLPPMYVESSLASIGSELNLEIEPSSANNLVNDEV
eukprot:86895_1